MTRLQKRRSLLTGVISPLAIACAMSVPLVSFEVASAQPTGAEAAAKSPLQSAVEDFWHYGKIARYDLAAQAGQAALDLQAAPEDVLAAFEAVAAERQDSVDQWLLRWQGVDEMRGVAEPLAGEVRKGWLARRSEPEAIERNIQGLSGGQRSYTLSIQRLRESGELAVPLMVGYLQDPSKRQYHAAVRQGLRDLGAAALNPLSVATEMGDNETLVSVVNILADIGYDVPAPYLAKLLASDQTPLSVKTAAEAALRRMGKSADGLNPASEFHDLAERLYYEKSAITVDPRADAAYVWYWDDAKGLTKRDVAPEIFHEILAQRASAEAMELGGTDKDALSLWLAANYKREAELPEGTVDPTRGPDAPGADFYGTQAGSQYLYSVLDRAQRDRNSAVALASAASLGQIVGRGGLGTQEIAPLVDALRYPDRRVRYESAFALASTLPQQNFDGHDRVVPLLAEALGQTGTPTVLLVQPDTDSLNALTEGFKAAGYIVAGGTSAEAAVAESATLPSVDSIVISEQLPTSEVDAILAQAQRSPRLEKAAKVITAKTAASPYAMRAANDPFVTVTQASDVEGLTQALDAARAKAGSLSLDADLATAYALRAAESLEMLGVNQSKVLDPSVSLQSLQAALNDERPEVVMAAGEALAMLDDKSVQMSLLRRASKPETSEDVAISLYNSLATNAKRIGSTLAEDQVGALREAVNSAASVPVRTAAAEARGALNLPPDEAKALILAAEKL